MEHTIPQLDRAGLRNFALSTGAIIGVLFGALFPWVFELAFPLWPWIVFGVLALWGLTFPNQLQPVYYWWMRFGLLLSKVTTPIIMGLVFFVFLLPTGLLMRWILRKDPMNRSFDKALPSYRQNSAAPTPDHFSRPF